MIILGIETSCDDTGISILEIENGKIKIISNVVSSQVKLHAKYGGIFPTLAKREHKRNLPLIFKKIKKEFGNQKIDLIAVTVGPGLEPCLWEGINFAKSLARKMNIPIVPVNHIEAHILVNFLSIPRFQFLNFNFFPAISLVVSGGHTQLILMKKVGKYKLLGETRDDAAGECLDKVARLLGLGYPGGPAIEKISKFKVKNPKLNIKLPRPMIYQKNYDFSFAGLKTAVLYDFRERSKKIRNSKNYKIFMAKEIQNSIFEVLISKTVRAVKEFKAKSIILGGGVIANEKLRKGFQKECQKLKIKIFLPKKDYCTDNGLMVALAGYFNKKKATKNFAKIKAEGNLKI